jgi:hypothetical protein
MRRKKSVLLTGCPTERQEMKVLAMWLDARGLTWCHPFNEARRQPYVGRMLKLLGLKKGVPDVIIFSPPPKKPGLVGTVIELKRIKGSRLSLDQCRWLAELERLSWYTEPCWGADEAIKKLLEAGY